MARGEGGPNSYPFFPQNLRISVNVAMNACGKASLWTLSLDLFGQLCGAGLAPLLGMML